jgi:hypothetical protein
VPVSKHKKKQVARVLPIDSMSVADIMASEPKLVTNYTNLTIDFRRVMIVLELTYGVVVETYYTDEEGITITETLFSRDREVFTIIGRWRCGGAHHSMRSYPRDSQFPLRSKVRL